MSANFDWQTEEDDRREHSGWDEPGEQLPARPSRRPPWRLMAVIGVLLVAVGALVWWRVDRRIEETTQVVRTDVIASHNVVQQAVADADEEIFRAFLSGRDPAWTAGELALFESGLFADRAPFGLSPVEGSLPLVLPAPDEEAAAGARPAGIDLSPDFNEAVVTVDLPYRGDDGQTFVLQQTTVFRRGDQRWLLAPPLAEFWGDWQTIDGNRLSLIYPQRDAAVAEQLAADLDAAVVRACATLDGLDCSADLYLTVRLDTNPRALADMARPLGALRRAHETADILELPAPTLVGRPAGDEAAVEAAYGALRDGYARHVVGAAVAQAVGYDCCATALLFATLLDYQLSQLGLMPEWPVGAADYQRVLDERITLAGVGGLSGGNLLAESADSDTMSTVRTAVDFLLHVGGGRPAAELQRQLGRPNFFTRLARRVLEQGSDDGRPLPTNVTQAWWLYALERAKAPDAEPALPDETLYLVCTAPGETEAPELSHLLRYEPEAGEWTQLYDVPGFIWMTPLPGRQTMLLQEFALDGEQWRTRLWRDRALVTAYVAEASLSAVSLGESDPTGERLMVYTYDPDVGNTTALLADLTACGEVCDVQQAAGLLTWSPDGAWALYSGDGRAFPGPQLLVNGRYLLLDQGTPFASHSLALGSGDGTDPSPVAVGAGYSPFWIDERTFGFIQQLYAASRGDDQAIVVATVDDPSPQTMLLASDLFQFLPEDEPLGWMMLAYVAANPQRPRELFIVALNEVTEMAFVFLYDRETRRPELRLSLPAEFNHSLGFSPDGRYLLLTGTGPSTAENNSNLAPLLLHDIAANRTIPLLARLPYFLPSVVYDWSAGGQLVLALDDNLIGLIDPDSGGVRLLAHNRGACTSLAWLEE